MARKNSKKKWRKEHVKRVGDYNEMVRIKEEKVERREAIRSGKTFKQKVEERREQTETSGGLSIKHTEPVVGSKIKQQKMLEQFKEMKLDRLSLMSRQDAKMENLQRNSDSEAEDLEEDQEMKPEKFKNRKRGKAYRKMVKSALQKASRRPILIKKKMEVDTFTN